jgi:hypothetical protein
MTAGSSIDPREFLHGHLAQASPDLMRELMEGGVAALLGGAQTWGHHHAGYAALSKHTG